MIEVAGIVKSLTKAQQACVLFLAEQYEPSPRMPQRVIDGLEAVRAMGLAERSFMDEGPALQVVGESALSFRLSACWHYRLTPLGLALRSALAKEYDRGE